MSPSTRTPHSQATARLSALSSHLSPSASPPLPPRRPQPPAPGEFRYFLPFQTSWRDNDSYGHLNNSVYQQYFDSIINHYLLHHAYPSPSSSSSPSSPSSPPSAPPPPHPIGLIASSSLLYASSLAYPHPVVAALAVGKLGRRSVEWSVGLFEGEYVPALAEGSGAGEGAGGVEGFDLEAAVGAGEGEGAGQAAAGAGRPVRIKGGKGARAAAWGPMTHVFVDEQSRKAIEGFEEGMRGALERLVVVSKEERVE
ncbi:hypothetical protein JCM6882_001642 [Rhodosporidiobolus microsporus]